MDTSKSQDKLRAAKLAPAPFDRDQKGTLIVDTEKLAKLWAANTEAMQAVGEGLVSVVEATNALIHDNAKTRETMNDVRRATALAMGLNILTIIGFTAFWILGL